MCKKSKGLHNIMDKCMKEEIKSLNSLGLRTIASCCGHKRYRKTIIIPMNKDGVQGGFEIFTAIFIPRTRKFYKKDKQGYYFIKEVSKEKS